MLTKLKWLAVALFANTLLALPSQAATYQFSMVGDITLSPQEIYLSGTFDADSLTGTISFGGGSNTLSLDLGDTTLTEADDDGLLYPKLKLLNGSLVSFDFNDTGTGFSSLGLTFSRSDLIPPAFYSGAWKDLTITPVPVPAAAWLFGSALLGLGGTLRRRNS